MIAWNLCLNRGACLGRTFQVGSSNVPLINTNATPIEKDELFKTLLQFN